MKAVRGIAVWGALASAGLAHAHLPPLFDWLDKSVLKRISITGRRTVGLHMHSVSGDREAFDSLNYFGQGSKRFTDTGQMTLVGNQVLGFFNFNMTLTDDRYTDPQSKRIWLDYKRDGFQLGYGDLTSASLLNTNEFARYTKTLSGATFGYNKGRLSFKALRTESKSSARTRSLQGANSPGPYFIGDSQIVNDSEEVKVDGMTMRQGLDYTINYQVGSITFVNRIVPPTSTIVMSYETLGYNSTSGTVQGAGLSYDMGKYGRLGFTAIEQVARGGTGLNSRTDRFQGYESPASPYILDFEPLSTRPIVVKVNGILQIENVDYVFGKDSGNNTIYSIIFFLRPIPAINEVTVAYTPKPLQTIDGDRRVIGFDYKLPLNGKKGFVHYSQASGELQNGINPLSGTARGVKAEYSFGDLKARASMRDVPSNFVTVETRGFNRNEKALDVGLDYQKKAWGWGLSANDSTISVRTNKADGTSVVNESKYANQRAFVSYNPSAKGITWAMEHNRTQSKFSGSDTKIDTTALSASKSFGKLNTRLSLEHQSGIGPITVDETTQRGALSLDALRFIGDYSTNNGWFFGGRASLSQTKTLGKTGQGSDLTLSTSYRPMSGPFDFEATFSKSDSGSLATLGGFQNGSGIGYGGNGFSGGSLSGGFVNGASDYQFVQITPNYRVSNKATLNSRLYQSRSSGIYNSNSETTSYGLGVTWDLGNSTLLTTSFDKTATRFLGVATRSDSLAFDMALMGNPAGQWSYRLGMNTLISGNSSDFAQDSLGFDGYMRYKINNRSNASVQFAYGRTSGYLPQTDNFFGAFYEHQLYRNVSLIGSYKVRRVSNLDSALINGAYRSNGFDLELNFNFGG
ncbi:MAG: hypothetical protein H7Y17_13020 [Chlorobia bacterium]|nr:hypothetical protein [Fimbriimonadaceae bacterium]